jgi:hypothetical protein
MKKRMKLLGLAVGIVAVVALAFGGIALADTPGNGGADGYCAGAGWHGFQGDGITCSETVSELLDLTPDEICELRQEGMSLAEIAEEQDVSLDELVDAILAERIEAVEAMVDDGTINEEQAELMIERMTERIELTVTRTATGPAEWRMGGGYGMYGEGTGPGLTKQWGGHDGTGTGYGDPDNCTGPGGMSQWGRGAH